MTLINKFQFFFYLHFNIFVYMLKKCHYEIFPFNDGFSYNRFYMYFQYPRKPPSAKIPTDFIHKYSRNFRDTLF
jgi:hypothetical protein